MTETEIGGVLLTVDGLAAVVVAGLVSGATVGLLMVLVTLFYGRR